MDKDFYWIRMYCEIEQDVYYSKGYSPLLIGKIGESSWPRAFKDYDYPKNALYNIYLDAYVDIYLDENGYREAYIRPIWFMYYIKGDHEYECKCKCKCIAVDVVIGKVIYR